MSKKSYYEKLKDPRWQKKRLRILERAGWRCQECYDDTATLHVHHGFYGKAFEPDDSFEPWDHPDDTLWALCENCHTDAEWQRQRVYAVLAKIHPRAGMCVLATGLEKIPTENLWYVFYALNEILIAASGAGIWPTEKVINGELHSTDLGLQWFQQMAVKALVDFDLGGLPENKTDAA